MPDFDHPPQFAESSMNSMIGEINGLSGAESSVRSVALKTTNAESQRALAALGALDGGVPVVITGSRPSSSAHFPGLREAMIGSAIFRLAEQIPADNPLKSQIQELALQLHYAGGEKISRQRARKGKKR